MVDKGVEVGGGLPKERDDSYIFGVVPRYWIDLANNDSWARDSSCLFMFFCFGKWQQRSSFGKLALILGKLLGSFARENERIRFILSSTASTLGPWARTARTVWMTVLMVWGSIILGPRLPGPIHKIVAWNVASLMPWPSRSRRALSGGVDRHDSKHHQSSRTNVAVALYRTQN